MRADTPFAVSFGAKDADKLWSHVMTTLRERLKCKCGGDMDGDEFLRKYNPMAAILNLLDPSTVMTEDCPTAWSMLHSDIVNGVNEFKKLAANTAGGSLLSLIHI